MIKIMKNYPKKKIALVAISVFVIIVYFIFAINNNYERFEEFKVYKANLNAFVQKGIDENVVLNKVGENEYTIFYKDGTVKFLISDVFYCNSNTPFSKELEFLETQEIHIKKEESSNVIYTIYNDICINIHIY